MADAHYYHRAHGKFKEAIGADSTFAYAYERASMTAFSPDEGAAERHLAEKFAATASPAERVVIAATAYVMALDTLGLARARREAAALAPQSARVWYAMAVGVPTFSPAFRQFRTDFLSRAIAIDSAYAAPRLELAIDVARFPTTDLETASRALEQGMKRWPEEPITYEAIASVRARQGRYDEAVAAFTSLVARAPDEAPMMLGRRGDANALAGHYDAARADFDAAWRLAKPTDDAWVVVERAYLRAYEGDFPASLRELRAIGTALDGMRMADSADTRSRVLRGVVYIAALHGSLAIADSALAEARGSPARNGAPTASANATAATAQGIVDVTYLRGLLEVYRGDRVAARAAIAELEALASRFGIAMVAPHRLRGLIALFDKDYVRAESELGASDPASTHAIVFFWRALAARGRGDTRFETRLLETALTLPLFEPEEAAVRFDVQRRLAELR